MLRSRERDDMHAMMLNPKEDGRIIELRSRERDDMHAIAEHAGL